MNDEEADYLAEMEARASAEAEGRAHEEEEAYLAEQEEERLEQEQAEAYEKLMCKYPGCKCLATHKHPIPIKNIGTSECVRLEFCDYHYYVVAGNHFICNQIAEQEYALDGPFKQVEIVEQVTAAIQMMAKIRGEKVSQT